MSRWHRFAGPLLVLPLVIWMVTGVLFHVKHRYDEAYEPLRVPPPEGTSVSFAGARISAAEVLASASMDAAPGTQPQLIAHPRGVPAWVVPSTDAAPLLIDARTGERMPPASMEEALSWARAAVEGSQHAHRYGDVVGHEEVGALGPALAVRFSGGKTVTVDRLTGEVTQTGALNDFIDWTYRLHYLQWTPWKAVNVALVGVAVPLVLLLALSGLWMVRRPHRPAR